ncbi:hypothetical protein ACG7TL_008082 [Trametes sanguinea]
MNIIKNVWDHLDKQEEEQKKAEEEAKKKADEEARRKVEEEMRRAKEERRRMEEAQRTEEVEKRTAEEANPRKRKSGHPDSEYEEEEEVMETGKGKGKEITGLLKPRAALCLNAKGLPAPMQAQVDKKSGESPQRKWVKKSAPIVIDDETETLTKRTKKTGSRAAPRSSEKGPGAAARVAESRGEGPGRVRLGREEKEWSTDPEPEQLTDRELLQHVLVEGQKTRLGMSCLLHHMEEEGEPRAQWALADSKVMRQAVRKEVGKWVKEELQPMIRAEIRSILAKFFGTPAEQEGGKGEGEGEGQEGEGEGEGGEEGAPAEYAGVRTTDKDMDLGEVVLDRK